MRALLLVVVTGLLSCNGCSKSATSTADAGAPAAVAAIPPETEKDDDRPVYPITRDPPEPAAERYCALVYEKPEARRKSCCPKLNFAPVLLTAECVRTLSSALRSKAVTIEAAALDFCDAAMAKELEQCDWGNALPAACAGIFKGNIGAGAQCRSSLECTGTLQCKGLGTSRPGVCAPPAKPGEKCGELPETLAAFIRQDALAHVVCEGHCKLGVCKAPLALGANCDTTVECGEGLHCRERVCSSAAFPDAGQSCAKEACGPGLRCVAGTCVVPARLGEACTDDDGCRSAFCDQGRCAMSCAAIKRPPKAP